MRTPTLSPDMPKTLEFTLEPVPVGRVSILARVTLEDKNDIVRVANHTGLSQQDVMRMCLMQAVRAVMKHIRAVENADRRIDEVMTPAPQVDEGKVEGDYVPDETEIAEDHANEQQGSPVFDPNVAPGARKS